MYDTFEVLKWGFAKDATHVFLGHARVRRADPGTSEQLNEYFSRDAKHVYYLSSRIDAADRNSFLPLEGMTAAR